MKTNTNNTANELIDILGAIELPDNILENSNEKLITSKFSIHINNKEKKPVIKKESQILKQFINTTIFGIKYILTSILIFIVLLVGTNFSAYANIVQSYIYKDTNKETAHLLLKSAEAGEIKINEDKNINKIKEKKENTNNIQNDFSIKQIISNEKENIDLAINIIPYENRIVIPKIGKNIPLIDIKENTVESKNKLDNILMKELEDGVVRYPGSAKPGKNGNSFIFGHSSNYPWIAGKYNDVFARLGQVNKGDIVFSYYNQKKYKYKIIDKKVVKPSDVGVLKNNKDKKHLTLMTCWPVGTTLNRLIVTAELVEK